MHAVLALAIVLATPACASRTSPPAEPSPPPASEASVDCTVRIEPGQDPTPHLSEGAVVCFAPGTHPVNLRLETSVTLVGEAGAVLDGQGKGPVVHIPTNRIEVALSGLTLTGGQAELGSGLFVDGYAKVTLQDVVFEGNGAARGGGVGLGARAGFLTLKGGRFGEKDDMLLTNTTQATIEGPDVQGDAAILDGAKVTWTGGRVGGTLTLRGTTTRAPQVTLVGVDGSVANDAQLPATLEQR